MARREPGVAPYKRTDGSVRYRVRLYHHGRQYKWSGFLSQEEAKHFYQDRKRDLRLGTPILARLEGGVGADTVAELLTRYLAQATNKKNFGGEQIYARFWSGWGGALRPEQLTPDRIDRARTHLLATGAGRGPVTHATVNRYVAWLHHVLKTEVDADRLGKNPCAVFVRSSRKGGQKFPEPKAPEEEFTPTEEAALARELGSYAEAPTLAILTGLRQQEQFRLRWTDLDFRRRVGRLPETKGNETQYFALNSAALGILRRLQRRAHGSPWVFPRPRDPSQPVNGKSWYAYVFKPAAQRAGIVISRKTGKTYHTLRHTFASRLQDAGADIHDIKAAGRWKTWQALARYTKRKDARVSGLVEKLGAFVPNLSRSDTSRTRRKSPRSP